jgi:hypothetical protein
LSEIFNRKVRVELNFFKLARQKGLTDLTLLESPTHRGDVKRVREVEDRCILRLDGHPVSLICFGARVSRM